MIKLVYKNQVEEPDVIVIKKLKADTVGPAMEIDLADLEFIQETLSFSAQGMLIFLWSLPFNSDIRKSWLYKQSVDSPEDSEKVLNELVEHGYIYVEGDKIVWNV